MRSLAALGALLLLLLPLLTAASPAPLRAAAGFPAADNNDDNDAALVERSTAAADDDDNHIPHLTARDDDDDVDDAEKTIKKLKLEWEAWGSGAGGGVFYEAAVPAKRRKNSVAKAEGQIDPGARSMWLSWDPSWNNAVGYLTGRKRGGDPSWARMTSLCWRLAAASDDARSGGGLLGHLGGKPDGAVEKGVDTVTWKQNKLRAASFQGSKALKKAYEAGLPELSTTTTTTTAWAVYKGGDDAKAWFADLTEGKQVAELQEKYMGGRDIDSVDLQVRPEVKKGKVKGFTIDEVKIKFH